MRYWIFDNDETAQRFPLQKLLRRAREVAGGDISTCEIFRAWGYGLQVHEWCERTDKDTIVVPVELLDKLSEGTEEWFYDIDVRLPGTGISYGLFDSYALFVEASPEQAKEIVQVFTAYRVDETLAN